MEAASLLAGLAIGAAAGGALAWGWAVRRAAREAADARQAADAALEALRNENEVRRAEAAHETERRLEERDKRAQELTGQLHAHQAQAERVPGLERELAELRGRFGEEHEKLARMETTLASEREAMAEQKALLAEAQAKLSDSFRALASEALSQNNQRFLELAGEKFKATSQQASGDLAQRQQAIDALVKPLREQLGRYEQQLAALEGSRKEAYGQLKAQLEALNDRTGKLDLALRTPHARGRWGEFQLRRVAELAGMIEFCDFDLQVSTTGEDGKALRPDMIVRLPGGGRFVVDAKTSLDAYLDAAETTEPAAREAALVRHADQVRRHMDQLASKQYAAQFDRAPDFVVMFLPGEHFLSAAIEQRPELIEHGFECRVILTSPSSLITLLRTAALAWREERLAENATRINKMATDLYERLAKVGEHLGKLGASLGKSVECYNQTIGSMETRVLPAIRKFPEMGVASKKEIGELLPIEMTPATISQPELLMEENQNTDHADT